MRKYVLFSCLVFVFETLVCQKINYICKSKGGLKVSLSVTPGAKPLSYQMSQVIINKYNLKIGNKPAKSFFLYKFENNLYFLNGTATKLNHTRDQALFSIPHLSSYKIDIEGILKNTTLELTNFTTINGQTFYKYNVNAVKDEFNLTEFRFDKNLDISELKLSSAGNDCSCTKSNVIIRLR